MLALALPDQRFLGPTHLMGRHSKGIPILTLGVGVAEPEVFTAETVPALKWGDCDEEGLVSFLVGEKNFSEERVRSAIRKLNANKGKSSQGRTVSDDCQAGCCAPLYFSFAVTACLA